MKLFWPFRAMLSKEPCGMKRSWLFCAAAAVLLSCLLLPAHGAKGKKQDDDDVEKVSANGRIDWTQGALYATGLGAVPRDEPNDAVAYLKAREYASMDAMRNLLMVIKHVHIDAHTVGADFVATNTTIRAEVSGLLKGPEIMAERKIKVGRDTMVEVTVRTRMYGDHSVASVFLPEVIKKEKAADDGQDATPNEHLQPVPELEPAPNDGIHYTSVIVDTRGFRIQRDMSPKIRRADGSEVWGSVHVNPDYVIEHGIVIYAHTLAEARTLDRAGRRPLVIRAAAPANSPIPSDAILNDEDADKLLSLNARDHFMDKFNVIFVVDPLH
jgi:hypothetical protein